MFLKKLIVALSFAVSVSHAETASLETEHFQVCETQPNEKIVVKYKDLISPELDCVNIYQSRAKEISKNKLLLSSVIGHGTGFNIEKLFIIRVIDDDSNMKFIKMLLRLFVRTKRKLRRYGLFKRKLRIYSLSNKEIFEQLRKRTKFEIMENRLKIIIDNKEVYNGSIKIDKNHYVDYCDEYFMFNLKNELSITTSICKKGNDATIYPDFLGDITFKIVYKIDNKNLKVLLQEPLFTK